MRKLTLPLLAVLAGGCGPFTRAQIDLVAQARRGVAMVVEQDAARDGTAAELSRLRRLRLDEAFDRDVRERALVDAIDPEWVVEARQAYSVALEAYATAQAMEERNAAERRRTLEAIDAALERLQWLQSIELKFDFTSELRENQR